MMSARLSAPPLHGISLPVTSWPGSAWQPTLRSALLLLLLVVSGARGEALTLRLSAYLPPGSVAIRDVILPWAQRVETRSDGRLVFDRYLGGALGRGPQRQYLLLQEGVSDIAFLFLSTNAGRFNDLAFLEAPLLADTAVDASRVAWQLHEEDRLRGFDRIVPLAMFTTSSARIFTRGPVRRPGDYPGLKLRTAGSIQTRYIRALGASAEQLDAVTATEVLRRGMLDGLVQGWTGLHTFRQAPMVPHFIDTPAGMLVFALAMNRSRFEALPEALRALLLEESGLALSLLGAAAYDRRGEEIRRHYLDRGVLTPVVPDDAVIAALEPLREQVLTDWVNGDPHRRDILVRARQLLAGGSAQ